LAEARATGQRIESGRIALPADVASAFAVQHRILALGRSTIGAWKVGANSAAGPVLSSPLPAEGLYPPGASVLRSDYWPCGLEMEIAFRFDRVFAPKQSPAPMDSSCPPAYSDDEVLEAIGQMGVTVEVVASRYSDFPSVDKLAALADLQCHGALVVGESSPYRADFPFLAPTASLHIGDLDVMAAVAESLPNGVAAHPVGDPRRMLPWFVNHCTSTLGIAVTPDTLVTTGSYSAMYFPKQGGTVRAEIAGLEPLTFTLR
jgi:2-keto-4-pentenoate hydratase